ncbi:MAG: NifU family protein [Sporolactobacillus sp.]|nr:NifU family protein [Sporolactobacillus sp.]
MLENINDNAVQIKRFLLQFRPVFLADGADFDVIDLHDRHVTVRLLISQKTCRTCIMPKETIQDILQANLLKQLGKKITIEVKIFNTDSNHYEANL